MNKTFIIALITGFLALAIAVAVFVTNRDVTTSDQSSANDSNNDAQSENTSDDVDMTIEMSDFKFSSKLIELSPGESITVKLLTKSGTHDFVIDEFDVDSGELSRGESKTVTITIPQDAEPGDYEFYCSIMDHRALGMVGTLRVK